MYEHPLSHLFGTTAPNSSARCSKREPSPSQESKHGVIAQFWMDSTWVNHTREQASQWDAGYCSIVLTGTRLLACRQKPGLKGTKGGDLGLVIRSHTVHAKEAHLTKSLVTYSEPLLLNRVKEKSPVLLENIDFLPDFCLYKEPESGAETSWDTGLHRTGTLLALTAQLA